MQSDKIHLAKFIERKEVAENTFEFFFKLENIFIYEPGQYVWLQFTNLTHDDPRGDRRAFSLTSIPDGSGIISIIFRASSSGFKKMALELSRGDEVNIIGPFGYDYQLPQSVDQVLVLLSAGAGVAPFLSLARYAIREKLDLPIYMRHFDSNRSRAVATEEVLGYPKNNKNIRSKISFSNLSWTDIRDIPDLDKALFYICGPQGFIDYAFELLATNGIFRHQMHFEANYPTHKKSDLLKVILRGDGNDEIVDEDKEVKDKLKLFKNLIEDSSNHIIVTDVDGRILFANNAAQLMTGFTFQEMSGHTPRLWGGQMSREFYRNLWDSKLKGLSIGYEIINRRKNGEIYYVKAHISPIRNMEGIIVGFIGTEEDVTEIKNLQIKTSESLERFEDLANKINEVYWIVELRPKERVVYVNPAFESIWGVQRESLYSDPRIWIKHIHEDDRRNVEAAFSAFLQNKSEYNIKYRIVNADGGITWIKDSGVMILGSDGNPKRIVGVARDITIEVNIDKYKTEFVSFASHQFKTPLTTIGWNIEILMGGDLGKLNPRQNKVVSEIHRANIAIGELVRAFLDISKIELGKLVIKSEMVDLVKLIDSVLDDFKLIIDAKKSKIKLDYVDDLEIFSADRNFMSIILHNLISNAIKYSKDGGVISIAIKKDDREMIIAVSDDGLIISDEDKPKIFTKFFRSDSAKSMDSFGTGMGLYLVREIINQSGGRIWFTSDEGEGTRFYIAYPLSGMMGDGSPKA